MIAGSGFNGDVVSQRCNKHVQPLNTFIMSQI